MEIRITNVAGVLMLLSGLPAIAQEPSATKAVAAADCASCPADQPWLATPGGPSLFMVVVAVAFIVGVVVGYLAAKGFGSRKDR